MSVAGKLAAAREAVEDDAKEHTTVILTEDLLRRFNPCGRGLEKLCSLFTLPLKISTDPVENIDIANTRASYNRDINEGWSDVYWFLGCVQRVSMSDAWPDSYNFDNVKGAPEHDAFVVAQWLAWIADKLATDEGR